MGQNERRSLLDICQRTSDELARDRSTKLLPIVVAQVFFIISIGLAFLKSDVAPTHTIALSALHLWLIPAVFLSAVIGVSQTENSIPEILKRFQEDINRAFGKQQLVLPDVDAKRSTQTRRTRGGIYSWQAREIYEQCAAPTPKAAQNPQNTASQAHNPQSKAAPDPEAQHTPSQAPAPATAAPSTRTTLLHLTTHSLLPSLPLLAAATTSVAISWLVPPLGYNCRTTSELVLTLWWLLLLATDFHPALRASFARTLFKDTLGTLCTAAVVLVTQAGAMNSCKCYSLSGTVGVVLPAHPLMAETAGQRMALTFACIALQVLVVPVVMGGWFADAVRVFVQRDDGGGDWHWWHWVCGFFAGWGPLGRWKGRAVGRGNAEYELVERRRRSG
ncbi:hypothetical protein MMC30_007602 [Trapelia coarctata]|nr:hypothetical protein [Trapelia coarctata]